MAYRLFLGFFALIAHASSAEAYTFGSPLSVACHEEISLRALADAGWPSDAHPSPLEDAAAIRRDLTFDVPGATADAWTLALVLGVRYNDLHGASSTDLVALGHIHGRDRAQAEHCLRGPRDDGTSGDASAVAACRAFIVSQLELALGAGELVDSSATTRAEIFFAFSGKRELELAAYPFHLGRAIHALQDSFSHAFRAPAGERIRHVLNFEDWAGNHGYHERRDGYHHIAALDECARAMPPAQARRTHAAEATRLVFEALRDPSEGRARRLERVSAVLDRFLSVEPGCTIDNAYCDAPERLEDAAPSCSLSRARPSRVAKLMPLLVALALWRRSGRKRARGTRLLAALSFAVTLALAPCALARAESVEASVPAPIERRASLLSTASASVDNGALAARIGGRYRVSALVELGVDAEYNPWFSLEALRMTLGTMNVFATSTFHWAKFDRFVLRSAVGLGASVLLSNLVAARAGSVGPFVELSLLGLGYELSPNVRLIFDPADLAVPIPHLPGVPFVYAQYRFTFGVQWSP